jgi:hypothetical protein
MATTHGVRSNVHSEELIGSTVEMGEAANR